MMRALGISFCLLFLIQRSFCQDTHLRDSLRTELQRAKEDTLTVNLLLSYGEIFEYDNPDSAIFYYDRANQLAERLNYQRGIATCISYYIVILNNRGDYRRALELCKKAINIFSKKGTPRDLCVALLNYGNEWQYLGDYQLAVENYLKALTLANDINDTRLLRILNNNIGSVYIELDEAEKGRSYATKALAYAEQLNDDYSIASCLINIAAANVKLKQYEEAKQYYKQVEEIGESTDNYILTLDGWLGLGEIFRMQKNYLVADSVFSKAWKVSLEHGNIEYELAALMGLSTVALEDHKSDKALAYLTKGIALARKMEANKELRGLLFDAAVLEEQHGRLQPALNYRKEFEALSDSMFNASKIETINLLEAKYQTAQKEERILQLEQAQKIQALTIAQKNTVNYVLIGTLLALSIVGTLGYLYIKQKQKIQSHRVQEMASEAILKGQDQERSRLAKDLHDGLGGMLSGIKFSLTTMKGNLVMTDDNKLSFQRSVDMIDSSIHEMRRIAHNLMPESLVKFGVDTALRDYCTDINNSGAIHVIHQSIGMEGSSIDQSTGIIIYRIVQELINNVLKHAQAREVIVQLQREGNQLHITVEDDGIGLDERLIKERKGMGWMNIQSRIDYLHGKIEISSSHGKGTSVIIELTV